MDRRHTRDDDTYDDNTHDGTYYTNDNTAEYSSRSGSIGSHTNASQTYDSKLHLSERVSSYFYLYFCIIGGKCSHGLSSLLGTQGLGCMG